MIFSDALARVMKLAGIVTDGFKLADVSAHFLPHGEMRIEFNFKTPTVDAGLNSPNIKIDNFKTPKIIFILKER